MRSLHITALRAAGMLVLVVQLLVNHQLKGQEVWPGDVNNNGIVNGIDLLYHGIAEGKTGPQRYVDGTNWEGHTVSPAWNENFADGINYSFADANGKGKVERSDRSAIWQENYGMTHGTLVPDIYTAGDAQSDPVLKLFPNEEVVYPGEALELSVHLGDAQNVVDHFFAITFTLSFDPDLIKDETTAPLWNPNVVSLTANNANWPGSTFTNKLESFIQLNNSTGELEVVIMRKSLEDGSGHGEIASIMVIIEDVVMLQDENTTFTVDKIKLIDDNMVEYPIAGSSEEITIAATSSAYVSETTDHDETANQTRTGGADAYDQSLPTATSSNEAIDISVYPNPVVNRVNVTTKGNNNELEAVKLYSATGQLLENQPSVSGQRAEVDMSSLPKGNYFLHLSTSNGTEVRQVTK